MKRLRFLRAAEAELADAKQYYDNQQDGLGDQLLDAVQETLDRIQRSAEMRPFYFASARSWRVRVFPYRILYRILDDQIEIVAVMHLKRQPNYWKNRI